MWNSLLILIAVQKHKNSDIYFCEVRILDFLPIFRSPGATEYII